MAEVRIKTPNGNNHVSLSTANLSGDVTVTLPKASIDLSTAGTDGQFLKTDGAGTLSFATVASSPVTALNNATANELVTVGSTTTELDAESGLTFDGNHLSITDGDLVIGTAGHGIDFSADAHATGKENETLDDYEEGTWTPALTYNGNSVSLNTPVGTYVKIGNFVCCRGRLQSTNKPNNGNVSITGLPFASSNPANDGNAITGAIYMENADSNVTNGHPIAFGFDNSSQFDCRYSGTTGGGTNVADKCKTGTSFMTTISYQTA